MRNPIFDEMEAEQYRKERMAEAKYHNELVRYRRKKFTVEFYCVLAKFIPFIREWVEEMKDQQNSVELNKEHR